MRDENKSAFLNELADLLDKYHITEVEVIENLSEMGGSYVPVGIEFMCGDYSTFVVEGTVFDPTQLREEAEGYEQYESY